MSWVGDGPLSLAFMSILCSPHKVTKNSLPKYNRSSAASSWNLVPLSWYSYSILQPLRKKNVMHLYCLYSYSGKINRSNIDHIESWASPHCIGIVGGEKFPLSSPGAINSRSPRRPHRFRRKSVERNVFLVGGWNYPSEKISVELDI